MISTQNVKFQYKGGGRHLAFPDLQCQAGGILLVTGQSGCGKTTLLHLMAGILKSQSGSIHINNTDLAALSDGQRDLFRAKNIGLVYQKAHFLAALPVLDNLKLPGWLGHHGTDKQTIQALAERLGVAHTLGKYPAQLSVGEQQRISMIRAVIHKPRLILADEPTSALDDHNCAEVTALLREMAAQQGAALVIVTHDSRLKDQIPHRIELS